MDRSALKEMGDRELFVEGWCKTGCGRRRMLVMAYCQTCWNEIAAEQAKREKERPADCGVEGHVSVDMVEEYFCSKCWMVVKR